MRRMINISEYNKTRRMKRELINDIGYVIVVVIGLLGVIGKIIEIGIRV